MSKNDELQKHTLNLRHGDFAYIEGMYRSRGIPASLVIRTIVANYVDQQREKEAPSEPLDLSLDLGYTQDDN